MSKPSSSTSKAIAFVASDASCQSTISRSLTGSTRRTRNCPLTRRLRPRRRRPQRWRWTRLFTFVGTKKARLHHHASRTGDTAHRLSRRLPGAHAGSDAVCHPRCAAGSELLLHMRDPHLLFKSRYNLCEVPEIDEGERRKMCQKQVIEKWVNDVPELATAYRLKEDFSDILQMNDRQRAEVEVDLWLERVREFVNTFRIRLQKKTGKREDVPFSNVLTVIKVWREYILNYISYKKRFELRPTNAFAESANGQIKRAQRLGNGYTYEVLRAKVVHGGLLMKRRPRLMLEEIAPRARRGSGRHRQGELQPKTNPNGNVIRLENVRESKDETKGLVPKSQSNEAWAKRFANLLQEVPSSGPNRMKFPIDIKQADTKPKKTRKKRVSRPTREMTDKSHEQLRMF